MAEHAFISYVRENSALVDRLAKDLRANGVEVWLDRDAILPGAYWQDSISNAISEGAFFIACFSEEMNARQETYMHGELRLAIDRLRSMPRERIWFIPVMLNETKIPNHQISSHEKLADINTVSIYLDWSESIKLILRVMGVEDKDVQRLRRIRKTHRENEGSSIALVPQLIDALTQFHGDRSPLMKGFASKDYTVRSKTIEHFVKTHRASAEILGYFSEMGRKASELFQQFLLKNETGPTEYELLKIFDALSKIGPYLDHLTGDLSNVVRASRGYKITSAAIQTIGAIGTQESGAVLFLIELATDEYFPCRETAMMTIGRFGQYGLPAVAPIVACYPDSSNEIKSEILKMIESIGYIDELTLDFVIDAALDEVEEIRLSALEALIWISRTGVQKKRVAEVAVSAMYDKSLQVRIQAVKLLEFANHDTPGALDAIIYALNGDSEKIFGAACHIIYKFNYGSRAAPAIAKLQEALLSKNRNNVRAAIGALGDIGPAASSSLDLLMSFYLSRDQELSEGAFSSIERITWR